MAIISGKLDALAVPGFPGYDAPFGTKKPNGQPISSREVNENVMLPFKKQRPIDVSETSSVINIESNLVFDIKVADVSLSLGEASFRGCRVKVLNSSDDTVTVVYSPPKARTIPAGKFAEFDYTSNGWVLSASKNMDGNVALSVCARETPFLVTTDKQRLAVKAGTKINFGSGDNIKTFITEEDKIINVPSVLDAGVLANGKDYYLFLCSDPESDNFIFKVSLTKAAPQGVNAANACLIGGFHTLCANVGAGLTYTEGEAVKPHPLSGYNQNDILPASVWCLNHRPHSEPEGMVYVSSLDFWCDIYLQSGSGANTKSAYRGAITRSRQYVDFVEDQFCVKKELLDDGEFAAAMLGSNEETAVAGTNESGVTTNGAGGRVDTAGRRMISIYGVEEGCGSLWQWLRTTSAAGYEGSMYGQTSPAGVTPITYGQFWSANGRTVSDSAGTNLMPNSAGPQAGGKGSFYYMCGALIAGGDWGSGAACGSRSRGADTARSRAHTNRGGRGRSRPKRFA